MSIWLYSELRCTADFTPLVQGLHLPELQLWHPPAFCHLGFEESEGTSEKCPSLNPPEGTARQNHDTVQHHCYMSIYSLFSVRKTVPLRVVTDSSFACQALKAIITSLVQGFYTSNPFSSSSEHCTFVQDKCLCLSKSFSTFTNWCCAYFALHENHGVLEAIFRLFYKWQRPRLIHLLKCT